MICRFIVKQNRRIKYITSIGQKTGTSKISKKVQNKANRVDFIVQILKNLKITIENKQIPKFKFRKPSHKRPKFFIS
jgi:hypothetical protein